MRAANMSAACSRSLLPWFWLLRGDLGLCVGLGLFGLYLLVEVLPWPLNLLASYLDRRNAI